MALALTTTVGAGGSGASETVTITVPSGTDLLVIQGSCRDNTNSDRVLSSVTSDNGTPLEAIQFDDSDQVNAWIYYIVSPTVADHEIVSTYNGTNGFVGLAATCWTASGTPTLRETASNNGTSTAESVSINPAQTSLLLHSTHSDASAAVTIDGAETQIYQTPGARKGTYSYKAVSSGATTVSSTVSNDQWIGVAAAFEDVTGGGSTGQIKYYNGSSFAIKPMKVYNGSSWVTKPVKFYNGSSWEETGY